MKLKVHESLFVPLAKWPMLIAGNYRCIRRDDMIPIKEAVHGDAGKSRGVYDWVRQLCAGLGAEDEDLVPFEKYAKAAEGLGKPSSAARALFGGAEQFGGVEPQRVGVVGIHVLDCAGLGFDQDARLFWYFRHHHSDAFPKLRQVHRTTFLRQAANLWAVKQRVQQHLAGRLVGDDPLWSSPHTWG